MYNDSENKSKDDNDDNNNGHTPHPTVWKMKKSVNQPGEREELNGLEFRGGSSDESRKKVGRAKKGLRS
uniref:Uncharacterized protein n=1 Tax=Cucumis melo TaxID=3656 RepID=A0A9I9E1S6_CUCME